MSIFFVGGVGICCFDSFVDLARLRGPGPESVLVRNSPESSPFSFSRLSCRSECLVRRSILTNVLLHLLSMHVGVSARVALPRGSLENQLGLRLTGHN